MSVKKFNHAGSNAGRGFRYQDAVSSFLAVKIWYEDGSGECKGIAPEGEDDADLFIKDGKSFYQIKSRRKGKGLYEKHEVAKHIEKLWERANESSNELSELVLVLENGINGIDFDDYGKKNDINLDDSLGELLKKNNKNIDWVDSTKIKIIKNPRENAIRLIVDKLNCEPILAELYFREIYSCIGRLSDENGEVDSPKSLSYSDICYFFDNMSKVFSNDKLNSPIKKGLCESIEFINPINDSNFYLGVNAQAGHVVSGQIIKRPNDENDVCTILKNNRKALIKGSAGSGKSSLVWLTAFSMRHEVKWFRINNKTTKNEIHELLMLENICKATSDMPIGFIIDDVGEKYKLWNEITKEIQRYENIILLGSIREEDLILVEDRTGDSEIEIKKDIKLAEKIYKELKINNKTDWHGWREPWDMSGHLLLEYVLILSQNSRFEDIIKSQIEKRRKEGRNKELEILKIVSIIGSSGGRVDLKKLQKELNISDFDLKTSLERLCNEHLIQYIDNDIFLSSTHQLRGEKITEILHNLAPPYKEETIKLAFEVINLEDIETFVYRILKYEKSNRIINNTIKNLIFLINKSQDLSLIIGVLRALDAVSISKTITNWIDSFNNSKLDKNFLATAVTFSFLEENFIIEKLYNIKNDEEDKNRLLEIDNLVKDFRNNKCNDLRKKLLSEIDETLINLLCKEKDVEKIVDLMESLVEVDLNDKVKNSFKNINIDLLSIELKKMIEILEISRILSLDLSNSFLNKYGQNNLISRLSNERPWSSPFYIKKNIVYGDIFSVIENYSDEDDNNEIFELCYQLLAICPNAKEVNSKYISLDGSVEIKKNIKRGDLIPKILKKRNNNMTTAISEHISLNSMTNYLFEVNKIFNILNDYLITIFEYLISKKKNLNKFKETKEKIINSNNNLIKPLSKNEIVNDNSLQDVVKYCSFDLLHDIKNLPNNCQSTYNKIQKQMKLIDNAIEENNWNLIDNKEELALNKTKFLFKNLMLIIRESYTKNNTIYNMYKSLAKSQRLTKSQQQKFKFEKLTINLLSKNEDIIKFSKNEIIKSIEKQKFEEYKLFVDKLNESLIYYPNIIIGLKFDSIIDFHIYILGEIESLYNKKTHLTIFPIINNKNIMDASIISVNGRLSYNKESLTKVKDYERIGIKVENYKNKDQINILELLEEISKIKWYKEVKNVLTKKEKEILIEKELKLKSLKNHEKNKKIVQNINKLEELNERFSKDMFEIRNMKKDYQESLIFNLYVETESLIMSKSNLNEE